MRRCLEGMGEADKGERMVFEAVIDRTGPSQGKADGSNIARSEKGGRNVSSA